MVKENENMKKLISVLLTVLTVISLSGCAQINSAVDYVKRNGVNMLNKNKAADYVKENGVNIENKTCVAFHEYFLDEYHTYFIVYNNDSDTFSFEYYTADKYFETPPTTNSDIHHYTKIDLSSGRAKYYSKIQDAVYTGTATIDKGTYNGTNNSLSNVTISGKYQMVYSTIEQTFANTVYITIIKVQLFLDENKANITLKDFGFVSFD